MRKFMFLLVLCGLISGQAWGDNGIFRLTNGNTYVCGDEDGTFKFADGNKVQTLGPSWLDNDSRPSHRYYTCSRSPWNPAYDDHWNSSDPNWCSDTELKDVNMANIKVCIYVAGEQKECYPQIAGRTDGCLHIRCEDGYRLIGGKCVEESKGCLYMGQTVAFGWSTDNADLGECKDRYTSDNWKNVEKVTSCSARCDASGVIIFTRTACANGWRNGSVETKEVCIEDTNGGDNGSTTKCPAGSSDKILSKKDCKSKERFECAKYGASNQCVCGKCIAGAGERRDDGDRTVGKCHPSVCKSEVCKECCKRPSSETIWDRTAQACHCVNGGKFQKENNTWSCKVDSGQETTPGAGYICDATLTAKFAGWKVQCASRTDIMQSIAELEEYCAGKPTKEIFLRLYDEVSVMARMCQQQQQDQQQQQEEQLRQEEHARAEALRKSRRSISDAHGILVGMRETFKASVWKDEEGKFNTSRLVSDSIAGVVLGTVGGVVTSNVVKKNQVENGFEDIKCTIGGQTVADWGDEFRVGIQ